MDRRGKLARVNVHQADLLGVEGEVHVEMMPVPGDRIKRLSESKLIRFLL